MYYVSQVFIMLGCYLKFVYFHLYLLRIKEMCAESCFPQKDYRWNPVLRISTT